MIYLKKKILKMSLEIKILMSVFLFFSEISEATVTRLLLVVVVVCWHFDSKTPAELCIMIQTVYNENVFNHCDIFLPCLLNSSPH